MIKNDFVSYNSKYRITLPLSWAGDEKNFSPSRWARAISQDHGKVYSIYIFDLIIQAISFILVSKCEQLNFL